MEKIHTVDTVESTIALIETLPEPLVKNCMLFFMREGIHPDYAPASISCACGAAYKTRTTRGDYSVEICAACHPFYTGKQKIVDTAGRVERFRRRYEQADKS